MDIRPCCPCSCNLNCNPIDEFFLPKVCCSEGYPAQKICEASFRCKTSGKHIPMRLFCDSVKTCPDGSDEI